MPTLLVAGLLGVKLHASSSGPYTLRLGLSDLEWKTIVSNTNGQVSSGYVVTQILRTGAGETLVRWSSTPGLDPKGPHALGVQVYGQDSRFRRWLPDTRNIDRNFVLCGRYLVGGQNTLRVWDTERNTLLAGRRSWTSLSPLAQLECGGKQSVSLAGLRLQLPSLKPLP